VNVSTVRRATTADAELILRCLRQAFEPYRVAYSEAGFADTTLTPEAVQQRLRTMTLFVACAGDDVVGTIGCNAVSAIEGHLRGMAVLPEWQGRGVAEQLLTAAEEELKSRGCTRVTLDTTEPLLRAMRFYERHGYRRSGTVRDFFGMLLIEYEKPL